MTEQEYNVLIGFVAFSFALLFSPLFTLLLIG